MIITTKKPLEEVMDMVGDAKTVAIVGCGSCATAGAEHPLTEDAACLVIQAHGALASLHEVGQALHGELADGGHVGKETKNQRVVGVASGAPVSLRTMASTPIHTSANSR